MPEFPLKKADNYQSTNADSLWFRHADGSTISEAWIRFELKTDIASCNDPQLDIYKTAMNSGMPQLLSDLRDIAARSSSRVKYQALLSNLTHLPEDRPIELVYLAPHRIECADARVLPLAFSDLEGMSLGTCSEVWDLFRAVVLPQLRG